MSVDAQLSQYADLGTGLTIRARGGYEFGADPLDNACCDVPIVSPSNPNSATWTPTGTVTPTLISISKGDDAAESETATGPNYPHTYTVTVDIAPGQTITNLNVFDHFDDNIVITGINNFSPASGSVTTIGGAAPALPYQADTTTAPDNVLVVNFPSVSTGTASFDVQFYVPETLSNGTTPILNPSTGDDDTTSNTARAVGSWTPVDTRDAGSTDNALANTACPTCAPDTTLDSIQISSVEIQKSDSIAVNNGNSGVSPTDVLEYTLEFQISDYFSAGNIIVDDIVSDGQRLDTSFTPTFTVDDRVGGTVNGSFNRTTVTTPTTCAAVAGTANMIEDQSQIGNTGTPGDGTDGSTHLSFCVSQAMLDAAQPDGILQGAYTDGSSSATAATGRITYRTVVQNNFSDTYPSGDASVDHGDHLTNNATISVDLVNPTTLAPLGNSETDDSNTLLIVQQGGLSKSIAYINGVAPGAGTPEILPGNTVTYRLTYEMPSTDFEDFVVTDYLPLPVFFVDDPNADGTTGPGWVFDEIVSGTAPAPGHIQYNSSDTFYNECQVDGGGTCILPDTGTGSPNVSIDTASNSLSITFGDYDDNNNVDTTIDLLFSVVVTSEPFADNLFLTNQAESSEGSTNAGTTTGTNIIQIVLREPVIEMTKGVIATDSSVATPVYNPTLRGPGSFVINPSGNNPSWTGSIDTNGLTLNPINSDLSNVDAGDLVTFAIVLNNQGGSGAFDLHVQDTLPPGYIIPTGGLGLNLQVRQGTGTTLTTTPLGSTATDASGLFDDGFDIQDPGGGPACQPYSPTSGLNIIIITYDLEVAPDVDPGDLIQNTAQVTNYSNRDNGDNFLNDGSGGVDSISDSSSTTITSPGIGKSGSAPELSIGDIVTYTVILDVPEGEMENAQVVDTLDTGLAFVDCTSITASSGDLSTSIGAFSNACNAGTNPTITGTGSIATFDFGTLTNANRVNSTLEQLTIVYTAVVTNVTTNQRDTLLNNNAVLSWKNGNVNDSASDLRVREADLQVVKAFDVTSGDADNTITVNLTISHTGASDADAFNVELEDVLPADLVFESFNAGTCTPTTGPSEAGGTITAAWDTFPLGSSCTISFEVSIAQGVAPNTAIVNNANIQWTSTNDTQGTTNTYSTNGVERTGNSADAGEENNYNATGSDTFTITSVEVAKTVVSTSDANTGTTFGDPTLEDLAIGETITYQIVVTFPKSTLSNALIQDLLPVTNGLMEPISAEVISVGGNLSITNFGPGDTQANANISFSDTQLADGIDDTVTFDAGNFVNTADGVNTTDDQVVVQITARLIDNPANQAGDTLTNTGQAVYDTVGGSNTVTDTQAIDVVESNLSITKGIVASDNGTADATITASTPADSDISDASADDTQTFRISVVNSGSAPAYEVSVDDSTVPSVFNTCAITSVIFDDGSYAGLHRRPVYQ